LAVKFREEMSSELLATYAGLGTHDGEHYYKGEECLACVKDLIRALRADDSRCEIRRELGRARVLHKDLLSILLSSPDDCTLRNDIIRLLVNLTQPAYLCFSESLPKGKDFDSMRCYMEVEEHLRRYKEAFTVESVLNVLGSVLADLCQKDWDHRDDDDIIIIERILLLIRNVLHVSPDPQEEKRTEDDVSVHDQLIWNLHINGIDELLLFLGSSAEETQWCMHVLEIIFLIFREQSPSALAATGRERTAEEKRRDEDLLEEALAKEREKKARAEKIRSARHSRFGGTFVVKNQRSISGSERVYHRQIAGLNSHSYDLEKRPRRTNKNRRPVCDPPGDRLSTFSIRLVLKNMCVQFLECCYNPLMKIVRVRLLFFAVGGEGREGKNRGERRKERGPPFSPSSLYISSLPFLFCTS
jgi:timeless